MASTDVAWSADAIADLNSILEFIALDSPRNASRVFARIINTVDYLAIFPRMGRRTPERQMSDRREVIEQPFRILYKIDGDRVVILNIFHGARDIGPIL